MDNLWNGSVRIIQCNMRLSDAKGLNPAALVETIEEHGANAMLLTAGGLANWYPSDVARVPVNPDLEMDFVQAVSDEAKKRGMKVLWRFDIGNLSAEVQNEHPDWIKQTSGGQQSASMGMAESCITSPIYEDYNFRILDEFLERYEPDAIFYNAIHYGFCHCERCRERYRHDTGRELPEKLLLDTEEGRAYMKYRYEKTGDLLLRIRRRIESHRPDTLLMHCGMLCSERPMSASLSGWDGRMVAEAEQVLFNETVTNVGRPQPYWTYLPGENASACNAIGRRGIICIHQACQNGRNAVSAPAHFIQDLAQAAFHGGIPAPVQIGAFDLEDRKDLAPMKSFFSFLKANSDCMTDYRLKNRVALVYSQKTNDYDSFTDQTAYSTMSLFTMGLTRPTACGDEYRGIYEALVHTHIPFEVLHDGFLEETDLSKYDFVILPGVTCLSDAAAEAIDRYVEAGGRLVVSGKLPAKDAQGREAGVRLQALPFEVQKTSRKLGNLMIADKALFPSLPDTDIVGINCDMSSLREKDIPGLVKDLRRKEWPKIFKVEYSDICEISDDYGMFLYPFGAGQVLVLPWGIGQMYRNQGIYECPRVFKDLMLRMGLAEDVDTDAPHTLEVIPAVSQAGEMIAIVNYTGISGKVRLETIPVHDVRLRVKTEKTKAVSRVTRTEIPSVKNGEYLEFTVPKVADYELIVLA